MIFLLFDKTIFPTVNSVMNIVANSTSIVMIASPGPLNTSITLPAIVTTAAGINATKKYFIPILRFRSDFFPHTAKRLLSQTNVSRKFS